MRNRIAYPLLVLGGLLGSMAIAQNLPSAPDAHLAAPAATDAEGAEYSTSALPPGSTLAELRGRPVPQFGRPGGIIYYPPFPPPPPPEISAPTGIGMLTGGLIGGAWGFNQEHGAARAGGAVAGLLAGALVGGMVGHIYHELHASRAQANPPGAPRPHCRHRGGAPNPPTPTPAHP